MKKLTEKTLPDSGAEFNKQHSHRLKLWRVWDDSKPKAFWIMLNPSTADSDSNDPTIRRLITFTKQFGYGGFFVGNLFTYITPKSDELVKYLKYISLTSRMIADTRNDKHLDEMFRCTNMYNVIFAWGDKVNKCKEIEQRANSVIEMFPKATCLGISKKHNPKHPLFLPNSTNLLPYNSLKKYKQIKGL